MTPSARPSYLYVWNSKSGTWPDYNEALANLHRSGRCTIRWRCNSKKVKPGDRCLLIKVGKEPKGIIASGVTTSSPRNAAINIELDSFLDYRSEKILVIEKLKKIAKKAQILQNCVQTAMQCCIDGIRHSLSRNCRLV